MSAPAPAAGFAARLRASPLGAKLAILSAVLMVLVVGTTFLVLRINTEREVRRVLTAELAAGQRALRQLQDRNLRLLLATSSLVSTSPTLRAALQTRLGERNAGLAARGDLLATIQREVERIFGDLDRDMLAVTDDSGQVLASSGTFAPRPGTDWSGLPAVRHALESGAASADSGFGLVGEGLGAMQVGCVAIVLQGFPIGVLVLGERLDRVAPLADSSMGTRAIVTAGETVLLSTLPSLQAGARLDTSGARGGDPRPLRIGREEFVAATSALGFTADGRPARLHLVRSLSVMLAPIDRSLKRSFALAALLAVVLVAAGATVVSRTTLRPLSRFVGFLRTGVASHYAEPHAPAEIATLTDAYNALIDTLHREQTQLEHRSAELAETNRDLEAQVRERERAERALRESEEQLRQSQKLEALGTLAGGVAHDFNNLLSVIMGYAHLTAMEAPEGSPLRQDLDQISQASVRASGLVKQLLAFSRKQVLQPRVVDLNQIVAGMETMLRRLIGEDMQLETKLPPRLARITADPGQVEQVVMNLVVNARDAMPSGGTICVETANVVLDEKYEHRPEAIAAGPAVMLAVSDTGTGMDAETRRRIFEPFFTTKEPGKGTGLGLSTVYGIVRQSGGSITVYSEVGKGTTFRAYFPPVADVSQSGETPALASGGFGGDETVLVVEDEAQVRALMRRALAGRGYRVLEASNGVEALEIAAEHAGPIHLLVSDVVMPQLSGNDLAGRLRAARPDVRVLFVSGHSEEAIARRGVLAPDSTFLQKPIVPETLARAVREALDSQPAAPEGA